MKDKTYFLSILAGIITATIFGLSFMFSKMALEIASPFTLLAYRFSLAFVLLSVLKAFRVFKLSYKNKPIGKLLLLGLFQPIIYFLCETYGIKLTTSSTAGIMIALIPIAVLILGSIFLKEIPSIRQTGYILLSVLGVVVIVVFTQGEGGNQSLIGVVLLFGAVLAAAIFNILSRSISIHFSSFERTYIMMGMGAVAFISLGLWQSRENVYELFLRPVTYSQFIGPVVYLGVLSSVVAFVLINFTLTNIEASKSATLANLTTVVSILGGVIILGDQLGWNHYIGALMILVGVWGVNRRKVIKKVKEEESVIAVI